MNKFKFPKTLFVSFSGGRTSAYMSKWLIDNKPEGTELIFTFANTGLEHEKTLEFVDKCDKAFGMDLVWVEADVQHGERVGTKHKIVNFETASRNGEPFEEVIKKYGLPNADYPHCNRELKLAPLHSFKNSIQPLTHDSFFAIGIRADEFDRMSADAKKNKLVYPLVSTGATKPQIINWWSKQNFDLELPEHLGNCVSCWKKSDRKLLTIAKHDQKRFDFFARMESEYGHITTTEKPRKLFRHERTTADIIATSKKPFVEFVDHKPEYTPDLFGLDEASGCEESCEPYGGF